MTLDLIPCPECTQLAEVLERYELDGIPHLKTRCVQRHELNGPAQ